MDHDLNVVGALVVMLGDRMRDGTEDAAGMGGAFPAALVALHEWAGGRTIETLAGGLRLSHSRTVRVIDRLESAGLAARSRDPADGRGVLVRPDARRAHAGSRVLDARAAALEPESARSARRPPRARGDRRAAAGRTPPPAGAPPGRSAGYAMRTRAVTTMGAARSPAPRTPPRPAEAASVRRRGGPFAVVVPDQMLHVMSEQPARRYVLVVDHRYGLGLLLGPLYADVEIAHSRHANACGGRCVAIAACIQVCRALRSASSSSGWAKR